jgi:N-acetylneuraminic acid mutarotase
MPGARDVSISWIDRQGNLWLFGGYGTAASGNGGLNDLWKFDGTNWTWVSGSNVANQSGVYGTKGVAAPSNVPSERGNGISWIDRQGNLWLFGGGGRGGRLNDLWKFDGTNWTWVSGSNAINQNGVYGTKGVADINNVPGGRQSSVSWIDVYGNLWLFGGTGYDASGSDNCLNDLWKFDGTNWTWVSGSNTTKQRGVYGTKGVVDINNMPGARYSSVSRIDGSGNLWLFGGNGYDVNYGGYLNDLWKFDGTNWTWVSGSNVADQSGVYGTKGVAAPGNVPGGRHSSISWIDGYGNLWLFGGIGYAASGSHGYLNDLWKFDGTNWTWVSGSNVVD